MRELQRFVIWFFGMLLGSLLLCAMLAAHAPAQTPHQVKACQLKYSFASEQLNTAFVALSDGQTLQREVVRGLAQSVERAERLVLQHPTEAFASLCTVENFGDLDAVVSLLRSVGYLPNAREESAFNIRNSATEMRRSVTCFNLFFPLETQSPNIGRSEKRSEAPGRFGGC